MKWDQVNLPVKFYPFSREVYPLFTTALHNKVSLVKGPTVGGIPCAGPLAFCDILFTHFYGLLRRRNF